MSATRFLEACPKCGRQALDIDLSCECGAFLLITPKAYRRGKASLIVQVACIVLATVTVVVLFRLTALVWPIYLFTVCGILHLYAAVFSRGAALVSAAVSSTLIAGTWLAWRIADFHLDLHNTDRQWYLRALWAGWALVAAYGYFLGVRKSIKGLRRASTKFLLTGALVFGLWGVWTILLENDLASPGSARFALLVVMATPVVCLISVVRWSPIRDGLAGVLAIALTLTSAYLGSTGSIIRAFNFLFCRLTPGILGVPAVGAAEPPWWSSLIELRAALATALLALAGVLVGASSLVDVWTDFQAPEPPFYRDRMRGLRERLSSSQSPFDSPAIYLEMTSLKLLVIFVTVSAFVAKFARTFMLALGRLLRRLAMILLRMFRYWIIPLCAFSALSILIILVLAEYRAYNVFGAFFTPKSLWGAAILVLTLTYFLCSVAFGYTSYGDETVNRHQRFVNGTLASTLLGSSFFLLMTLISAALILKWSDLNQHGLNSATQSPEGIYRFNLIISGAALVLLLVIGPIGRRAANAGLMIVVIAFVGTALAVGTGPLYQVTRSAASAQGSGIEQGTLARVPANYRGTCRRARLLPTGAVSGIECRPEPQSGAETISYFAFTDASRVNRWYQSMARAQNIPAGRFCGSSSTAMSNYGFGSNPNGRGQIACFGNDSGSWLIWTYTNYKLICIAHRGDGRQMSLNQWWTHGGQFEYQK